MSKWWQKTPVSLPKFNEVRKIEDIAAMMNHLGFALSEVKDMNVAIQILEGAKICHAPTTAKEDTLVDVARDIIRYKDDTQHVLVLTKQKNAKVLVMAIYEADKSSKQASLHILCKCTTKAIMTDKYYSKSCDIKGLAIPVIYFIAFLCRDKYKCDSLQLIAQSDIGQLTKLKGYYKKLGFVEEGTNMVMPLNETTGYDFVNNKSLGSARPATVSRQLSRKLMETQRKILDSRVSFARMDFDDFDPES